MARSGTVSAASRRSWLPAVHRCLESPPGPVRAMAAGPRLERAALDRALGTTRRELEERPDRFREETDVVRAVDERWKEELERLLAPALRPLVNATGVVVHTNLGRAPLAARALDAALDAGLEPDQLP